MWLLIAASIAACAPAPTVPYQTLTEGLGPLRDAFNKAADRTRLLVLVAPT